VLSFVSVFVSLGCFVFLNYRNDRHLLIHYFIKTEILFYFFSSFGIVFSFMSIALKLFWEHRVINFPEPFC
jgi:hypothetical protein